MKLRTKQDIEAPIAFVFKVLTDFDGWERSAMRRGADVNRTDKLRQPGSGMTWLVKFVYRGKNRTVSIRVDAMDGPGHLALTALAPVFEGSCKLELLELSAKRTRVHIEMDGKPKTFFARLYFQSLRLAKSRVERSLNKRAVSLAVEVQRRFEREAM